MKRYGLAAFALAAVMALGAAGIPAMADTGWRQEGGSWVYYNANGTRVTDAWRQGADGSWRYLDGSGYMAVNMWVDNDNYYVDSNGMMASNKWLKVANADKESGYDWYYFSQSGKCVKGKWEKIDNKWYYFGDTGAMQTGWILDNMYYCDSNGAMVTGWKKLAPPDENVNDSVTQGPYETEDDGKYWYYFGTNGKKTLPKDDGDGTKVTKINGINYCLGEDGAMQTGWVCVNGDSSDQIEDYRYVDSNGQVRVGWYSAEPPEHLASRYNYDVVWFYFNSKGVPKVGPTRGTASTKDIVKINGNSYLFDENGVPVYGLQKVYTDSEETSYTAYYFGTREQSSMLSGKFNIKEGNEARQYYFTSTGRGYTGVHDSCLYYMGKLQKADSSSRYEVFTIPTGSGEKNYVVNTSGHIVKNSTVRDRNGVKYKTSSSGTLLKEDDEEATGTYTAPEEPDWSATDDD